MKETELYGPIKTFLEAQGFEVKSEVCGADVVAMRDGEDPVVVEMKLGFSLALVHQVIERQAVTDMVYAAVPRGQGRGFQASLKRMKKLFRRLGVGLITVRLRDGFVQVHFDPAPFQPRKMKARQNRLLGEFQRRAGDPNVGGSRNGVVTAYRQDAMRCAAHLAGQGPCKGAEVARETGVEQATRMMRDNHYGWFCKVETGIYDLTPEGRQVANGMA